MIRVTKFDGKKMILNADWIQSIEETPDTLITLTTGTQFMVKDRADDIVRLFLDYRSKSKFSGQLEIKKENT